MKDIESKTVLEDDCTPYVYRSIPVAYDLREQEQKVERRLQQVGVISPVDSCEWTTPVVLVIKKLGDNNLVLRSNAVNASSLSHQ